MKFFSLIKKEETIHVAPEKKVIPAQEFSTLIQAADLLKTLEKQEAAYRRSVSKEGETLKEQAELAGFEEGLKQWNQKVQQLEDEVRHVRQEMQETIVPLALTAVKKIIEKELETDPRTILSIVSTVLKTVSQHRRIFIYVNKADLEIVESQRPHLKKLFEHLEILKIEPREEVDKGGCIIQTEVGIINAQLDSQLKALETTFRSFFQNQTKKSKK